MEKKNDFGFKELIVWHKAIEFAEIILEEIDNIKTDRKHYRLIENMEACSVSVSSNIAEGKGRYSKKEYIHYLHISRGSLYESISKSILFNRKGWFTTKSLSRIEEKGTEVVKLLNGLINSLRA